MGPGQRCRADLCRPGCVRGEPGQQWILKVQARSEIRRRTSRLTGSSPRWMVSSKDPPLPEGSSAFSSARLAASWGVAGTSRCVMKIPQRVDRYHTPRRGPGRLALIEHRGLAGQAGGSECLTGSGADYRQPPTELWQGRPRLWSATPTHRTRPDQARRPAQAL
jgi:hypothetical protein